jgi:hypothetical protein
MLLGNNLFDSFKEDVSESVNVVSVYANTFRCQFIDIAGNIVERKGRAILEVPKAIIARLQLDSLFKRLKVGLPKWC